MNKRTGINIGYTILSLSAFVTIWYIYVIFFQVPAFILPSPYAVLREFLYQLTQLSFYINVLYTLIEVLLGFTCSLILGCGAGYQIGKHTHVRALCMPILVFFQVSPKIALIPIFIIWFGLGFGSKLFVVFIMSFFPILEAMLLGLKEIPDDMYECMRIMKANRKQILRTLEIPFCLPYFLSSCKVSIIQAIIGATVAEWMAGQIGIGYMQSFASSTFNSTLLITGIVTTIGMGILLYHGISLIEKRLLFKRGID